MPARACTTTRPSAADRASANSSSAEGIISTADRSNEKCRKWHGSVPCERRTAISGRSIVLLPTRRMRHRAGQPIRTRQEVRRVASATRRVRKGPPQNPFWPKKKRFRRTCKPFLMSRLRWQRGFDLNQRPYVYERLQAVFRNFLPTRDLHLRASFRTCYIIPRLPPCSACRAWFLHEMSTKSGLESSSFPDSFSVHKRTTFQ